MTQDPLFPLPDPPRPSRVTRCEQCGAGALAYVGLDYSCLHCRYTSAKPVDHPRPTAKRKRRGRAFKRRRR